VETDKTTDEIQAPVSGVLLKIVHGEKTAVPVNAIIAVIGSAGEHFTSIPELGGPSAILPPSRAKPSHERIRISPSARRLARERGIDVSKIQGTGPSGRIVAEERCGEDRASPFDRRIQVNSASRTRKGNR
jgi:pyruvate dehydrogenase E2 component (dihydrolipoamide acetyltransferase)